MDPLCLLGQALECSVCLDQLDTSSRVLPCQHTFCKSCLVDIINTQKELRCPECRVLVTVPFNELPPNILLLRILEGMKRIPQTTSNDIESFVSPLPFANFNHMLAVSSNNSLTNTSVNQIFDESRTVPVTSNMATSFQPIVHARTVENAIITKSVYVPSGTNPFVSLSQPINLESLTLSGTLCERSSTIRNSLIQTMPAFTQTRPTASVTNLLFSPPKTQDICSSAGAPFSNQSSFSNFPSTSINQSSDSATLGSFPFQPLSSSIATANAINNGQQHSSVTLSSFTNATQPSPSNLLSACLTATASSVQCPPSTNASNLLFSASSNVQTSNFSSPLSTFNAQSVAQPPFPPVLSSYLASTGSVSPSTPFTSSEPSVQLLNTRTGPTSTVDNVTVGISSDGRSLASLRAEAQFLLCSSMIEKGSSMIYPSNTLARAIFSYQKREPRDLSFKKGDLIQVRKKIDENWFQGELGGQLGFFPASYVKLLDPLPSNIPQCRALFDFKMTSEEEKDCLTFNKGDIIAVLRRIDGNWAEGKLQSRVGIFPLSFVELNLAANTLIKAVSSTITDNSRITPPLPPVSRAQILDLPRPPASPLRESLLNQQRKRHSFADSAPHAATHSSSNNRLSLEVTPAMEVQSSVAKTEGPAEKSRPTVPEVKKESSTTHSLQNLQFFIATHSYRPRKADELELKKSQIYSVSEKCRDGWFKGRCLATDKIGVFPGNYVAYAKLETLAAYRSKLTGSPHLQTPNNNSKAESTRPRSSSVVLSQSAKSGTSRGSPSAAVPPDLPPRLIFTSSTAQSFSNGHVVTCSSPVGALSLDRKSAGKEKPHSNGTALGIMRKFTGSKKCKSPPLVSIDNPVFDGTALKNNLQKVVTDEEAPTKVKPPLPLVRERYRCIAPYPPNSADELELEVGDVLYVHTRRQDGWFKGTLQKNAHTGFFPASFVERC